jgi:hypothetical protein
MPAHVDITGSKQAVLVYQASGDELGAAPAAGPLDPLGAPLGRLGITRRKSSAGQTPTRAPGATFDGTCQRGICHWQDREIVLVRASQLRSIARRHEGLAAGMTAWRQGISAKRASLAWNFPARAKPFKSLARHGR